MADSIKILYVEDDELDRMALRRFIQKKSLNYVCDMATSVTDARFKLAAQHYDAVLIDYNLGDGTAFDILREIDSIAIILLTGLGDEQIAAQSIKLGAYDYLIKDTGGHYLEQLPETIDQAISAKTALLKFQEHHDEIERLIQLRTQELSLEIEERKKVEKALQQMNNELEERVRKRTELLNQSVLVISEAQNQLIESERAITVNRLMNNLSQKINTPVGTNITLTTFLHEENSKIQSAFQNGALTRAQLDDYLKMTREILEEIQNNLNISAALIRQFKAFNKRKLMDEITDFHLATLANEVLQLLETKMAEAGLSVSLSIDPDLITHNYPSVLRHIFFNLFMHALAHAHNASSEQITIEARIEKNQLFIAYEDTLAPIPEDELYEIFDTFYVLNRGDDARYIELNTTYTLIQEIEKGQIQVCTPKDSGNRFTLSIPLVLNTPNTDIDLDELLHSKRQD